MSFKTNDYQQLSLDDSFIALTERERKALEKSWAKIFADEIFPSHINLTETEKGLKNPIKSQCHDAGVKSPTTEQ